MIKYFKAKKDRVKVNTKILLLHVFAFGLYLLIMVVVLLTFTMYALNPLNQKISDLYTVSSFFAVASSFVA